MKIFSKLLVLVFVLTLNFTTAQISVGPRHIGKLKKFNNDEFQKFKNTKTLFVLPDIIDKDTYFSILDKSWKVTPYELMHIKDFDKRKLSSEDNYSFAQIRGYMRSKTMKSGGVVNYLHIFLDVTTYDYKKLKADLEKNKGAKKKKIDKIYSENELDVARVELFPSDTFIHKALSLDNDEIMKSIYFQDDVFFTYEPGFLQNILQKINNLIDKEEQYWMYETDFTKELVNLKTKTLYIPSYHTIKYKPFKGKDTDREEFDVEKLFSSLDCKYKVQDDEELNERILQGEEFYYLRYCRVNSQKFFHIVNSKTGEVIYRDYVPGFSYNIKPKHLKEINQKLKKASKKK